MKDMDKKEIAKIILILLISFLLFSSSTIQKEKIKFKGFGWYGYLADDELTVESIREIKKLGGNAVNINIYYEYEPSTSTFILRSNLTKLEEKIELAHRYGLNVFLSPFVNLVGGYPTAAMISKPKEFLSGAKNISVKIAEFAQKNNVEIYGVWNELGLALLKFSNSTNLTNEWLQDVRQEVRKIYKGILTTKEGVQLDLYRNYNFSGYDCIGLTFYPFTTSFAKDPYRNYTYAGIESLEEYEKVVKKELENIEELKKKFDIGCVILGEIGIDVIGGEFVGNDEKSKEIRAKAYEIVLKNGIGKIDGFFFSKFEHEDGGSEKSDKIFKKYFKMTSPKLFVSSICKTFDFKIE